MSSSDVRMLEELTARVVKLEACAHTPAAVVSREEYEALADKVRAVNGRLDVLKERIAALLPKEMAGELYGAEPDHAADRAERAAMVKRPPRSLP